MSVTSAHTADPTSDARTNARHVADLARSFADQTEQLGHLHPKVLHALQSAALPQLLKPGRARCFREFIDTCGILAEGCMSTGWCNFVWGMHNYVVGLYPQAVRDAVWSPPETLVSASLGPAGRCDGVSDAGAVVSGRWKFNSGCDHADWLLLGFTQPQGEPMLGLFHRSEYTIDDTWQVMGLRGTGSKDALCDEVHLPAERILPFSKTTMPFGAILILVIVGPVIGGAQSAVDAYAAHVKKHRIGGTPPAFFAEQPALLRLAESSAEVDAARTLVLAAADALDDQPTPNGFDTARIIRDTAYAAKLCNQATRRVFEAAGGSALHESQPMQRIFRDVTAGCAHARLMWDTQALPFAGMLAN